MLLYPVNPETLCILQQPLYKRRGPLGSYIGKDVSVHSPESVNGCECVTEEACRCVVLLQQCEHTMVDKCYLEF
jgi:hypothetical protein